MNKLGMKVAKLLVVSFWSCIPLWSS